MSYQPPYAPTPSGSSRPSGRGRASGCPGAEYELGELVAINQTLGWVLLGLGVIGLGRYVACLAPPSEQPPGWLSHVLLAALLAITPGTVKLLIARALNRRHGYGAAVAVAVLDCIFIPIGTIIGCYCLYMLTRPGVRGLLRAEAELPASPGAGER